MGMLLKRHRTGENKPKNKPKIKVEKPVEEIVEEPVEEAKNVNSRRRKTNSPSEPTE